MPLLITEHPRRPFSKDLDQNGTETRSGDRTFNVTGVATDAEAFAAMEAFLDAEGRVHPQDANTAVQNVSGGRVSSAAFWEYAVSYSSRVSEGGDLLLEPPEITLEPYTYIEQTDRDVDGVPFTNTAGFPFDTPLEIERIGFILTVSRWESDYPAAKNLTYGSRVNQGNFAWPGGTQSYVSEGQAKFLGVFQSATSSIRTKVRCSYKFDLRAEGHQKNVIDQGAAGYTQVNNKRVSGLFVGSEDGAVAGEPLGNIRLDGSGSPLLYDSVRVAPPRGQPGLAVSPVPQSPSAALINNDLSTATAKVLTFKRHKLIAFSGLGI